MFGWRKKQTTSETSSTLESLFEFDDDLTKEEFINTIKVKKTLI